MEKHIWHRVISQKNTKQPCPRWGHCSITVGDQILFFGGYADSNYMNDIWSYNTLTMNWTEIKTTGNAPSHRSNCTINYDSNNNRLIIFGGGGPNKKRFNSLNILDLNSNEWREIVPNENQTGPWQRTYHSAQLLFPYLIIFGGQGVNDLDDLWVFDFQNEKWSQKKIDKSKPFPCARRFHSSALVGREMFIIAGCYSKYRCLSDIYSLDLNQLFEPNLELIEWKQVKLKGSSFLTRWGHTSAVHNNKIYVFGGRFSNDLNDILVIDPLKQTLKTLKVGGDLPKARRRHSASFIGSCLIIFGGFNGQYFNDLFYINTHETKLKSDIPLSSKNNAILNLIGKECFSDFSIESIKGESFAIHKGLIISRFASECQLQQFLEQISIKYSISELAEIMECLYTGIGKLPSQIVQNYHICLFDSITQRDSFIRQSIEGQKSTKKLLNLSSSIKINPLIELQAKQYKSFIQNNRNKYYDCHLIVNNQYYIPINKALACLSSQYFYHILGGRYQNKEKEIELNLPQYMSDIRLLEVVLNYIHTDYLIVPQELSQKEWILLAQLAQYFCLKRLISMCQTQLNLSINNQNCEVLLDYGLSNKLSLLSINAGEYLLRIILQEQENTAQSLKDRLNKNNANLQLKRQRLLHSIYNELRFDFLQIQRQHQQQFETKNQYPQIDSLQKENNELSYNQ